MPTKFEEEHRKLAIEARWLMRSPALLAEARDWLLDCEFRDTELMDVEERREWLAEQTDRTIAYAVATHHDGGIPTFIQANQEVYDAERRQRFADLLGVEDIVVEFLPLGADGKPILDGRVVMRPQMGRWDGVASDGWRARLLDKEGLTMGGESGPTEKAALRHLFNTFPEEFGVKVTE